MNVSTRVRRWIFAAAVCLVLFTVIGFFVLPPIVKAQAVKRLAAELGRTVTLGKVRMNPYALSITLEDFDIREKDGQHSFVGWQRLYVNFDALSSLTGDWVLSDIELQGFHSAVEINADGSLNFADVLAKLAPPKNGDSGTAAKPGRAIRIVSLKVADARVDFRDRSRKSPFASTIGPMTFVLTEFRTAGARGAPYHFAAVTEAGEKLSWSGTLAADPVASKGEFDVANLILKKYTPYLEDLVQADLADGKLAARGHYELSLDAKQRVLRLSDGEVHLRDLDVKERASNQSALNLPLLDVVGIQADAIAMKAVVG
ncbi:MAG: hypothetical protein JWM35_811, partial [Verrucomicrobia bacterium]|nr:hypothetical protein [Verrucomicrobiota bacterium]